MLVDFGLVLNAILFAFGAYWCYEVMVRWRSDLQELREVDDNLRRAVIVGMWALTLVIAILVVNFALSLVESIAAGLRGLF